MKKGLFIIVAIYLLMACGDGNVVITPDPDIQLAEDSIIINDYLIARGITDFETTELGVRYKILERGIGDTIDESDILSFGYIGMLTNDTIFDTSIKAVGDSIRAHFLEDSVGLADKSVHELFLGAFAEGRTYAPITITYSASGWTINGQFVQGFSDGVSVTMNKMRVGGRSLIVMPSALAYGTRPQGSFIPANSVLVFELRPLEVTKQP